MPMYDVISAKNLPTPTYTDAQTAGASIRFTYAWHLGPGTHITEGETPTGEFVVIDTLDPNCGDAAVYRFPDVAEMQTGSEIIKVLRLIRWAAAGDACTRAYTALIDPETGDTSAQIALLEHRHPDGRVTFNLADNRGTGLLDAYSSLARATATYSRALDAHAEACTGVNPYGDLARLTAQQAAYRARLDHTNARLAQAHRDLPPGHP